MFVLFQPSGILQVRENEISLGK